MRKKQKNCRRQLEILKLQKKFAKFSLSKTQLMSMKMLKCLTLRINLTTRGSNQFKSRWFKTYFKFQHLLLLKKNHVEKSSSRKRNFLMNCLLVSKVLIEILNQQLFNVMCLSVDQIRWLKLSFMSMLISRSKLVKSYKSLIRIINFNYQPVNLFAILQLISKNSTTKMNQCLKRQYSQPSLMKLAWI